jgi:Set1/Ash2 histone methyltransferase complex subunit ASH2
VRRNPIFEEMRQQMDAVVAAVHPKRERDGEDGKKQKKESLADRVEKAVAISMTEEEKANIERERREAAMYWPVCLNPKLKPKGSEVSEDRTTFTSSKGYRTCAASHGVRRGAFYYEIVIAHLGESGHARVGWKSKKGEANAPVGYDKFGYGYRDVGGEKVHEATLAPYGEPFKEGDVIGCYIFVEEMKKVDLKKEEIEADSASANASFVAFARNGVFQGKAYVGLNDDDGAYFPAGSLFTAPDVEPAKLVFNFGPDFQHPPDADAWGVPEPRPMSDLDPPRPPPEIKLEPSPAETAAAAEAPVAEAATPAATSS